MNEFKEKMNLLFVSSIGEFLIDQDDKYIVKNFSEDEYFIKPEPSVVRESLRETFPYICYDYDTLPKDIQEKYKFNYQTFEQINGNLYKMVTKEYKINRKKK